MNSNGLSRSKLSIFLFVLLSYIVDFFTYVIESNLLLIVVVFALGILILHLNDSSTKDVGFPIVMIAVMTITVVAINMLRPSLSNVLNLNRFVILFVYFTGFSLVIFCNGESKLFDLSLKMILIFSVFYAISVWFHFLFPNLYQFFLNLMSKPAQSRISRLANNGTNYTGFTHNPGITAGYIITGIILLFADYKTNKIKKSVKVILILFLIISVFMTGKRAHSVFILLSILAAYVLPSQKKIFQRRLLIITIILLICALLIFLFWDYLIDIPMFSRINILINNLNSGSEADLRVSLYALAWSHFIENPLFGIGWGNFRFTVIGTITKDTEFEVHNIYLQLLCETGIIGFLLIVIPIIGFFIFTLLHIKKMKEEDEDSWFVLLIYSLTYQIFFILYGFTENPLFNSSYLMMYFFCLTITMSFSVYEKQQQRNKYIYLKDRYFRPLNIRCGD